MRIIHSCLLVPLFIVSLSAYAQFNTAELRKLIRIIESNLTPLHSPQAVTSGTNGSCGYYCTAQKGYDYVTGFGSPIASALIPALAGNTPPLLQVIAL